MAETLTRLARWLLLRTEAGVAYLRPPVLRDADLTAALSEPVSSKSLLFQQLDASWAALWSRRYPEALESVREQARRACEHRFDWFLDPLSGYRWSPHTYFKLAPQRGPRGAEILNPWWLSSFYHAIPLGKLCLAGGAQEAEQASRELVDHLLDWSRSNRYPFGINWRSTTIVSLRLVHWIWAWFLLRGSPSLPDRFRTEFLKQILLHARHIRKNLEWFPVRTNHYLANLAGLLYAGLAFPEFREAEEWLRFSCAELQKEMGHQVTPDGVDHEGSLNYHRFAAEIFLSAALLGKARGLAFSDAYGERLEKMLEFLLHALRPDGELPRVGDASDIRLQNLDSRDVIADPKHLLALGAVFFRRGDFKQAAGPFPEYAYWLLGEAGLNEYQRLPAPSAPVRSRSFPEGGFHILRHADTYVLIRCGALPLQGVKGHWHYDQLGFELFAGEPVLVDPGWHRYEADPEMFRYFKSTAAHNTVVIDSRDQVARDLFAYPAPSRPAPRLVEWRAGAEECLFVGEHALYGDLADPVTHRREIRFHPEEKTLRVRDTLRGSGSHRLEWNFHFALGIRVSLEGGEFRFSGSKTRGVLDTRGMGDGAGSLVQGWVGPGYGVREQAPVARWSATARLPLQAECAIRLG